MIGERVRALWAGRRAETLHEAPQSDADGDRGSEPNSKLFRCPECDVVYLALEKETCSDCRCSVTEVSPTLSTG